MRSMTIIAVTTLAILISIFATFSVGCGSKEVAPLSPSVDQARPIVAEFLESEFSKRNHLTLSGPQNVSVGEYMSELKAWPVYADYKAEYYEQGRRSVEGGENSGSKPTCFISNKNGKLGLFQPTATSAINSNALRNTLHDARTNNRPVQINRQFSNAKAELN